MVRRKHFIGMMLMGLLAVAACTSIKAPEPVEGSFPELCAIDSLMWRQPDSALAVLLEYDGNTDGFNGHYAQLLASELLYKNDYEQTNRPELQRAVGYFDSLLVMADTRHASAKTAAFLAARARYINGVGYYERDSIVEACGEYLKALEIMESHFEEKELIGYKAKFMALTYTHLTALYSDQYLHEQAIYFGQLSLPYYQKHDATPWHLAWMFNQIGSHYEIMERFDSSAYYYRKAIDILNDTSYLLYRDIVSHQTMLEYKTGNPFKKTLAQLKRMLFLSQNDNEFLARCATIGEIFYHERQFDSALVYLNQVFRESQNEELKKQDAELLVEILKSQGRDLEILEYAEFLVPFANLNENQGYLKSELADLCIEYKQKKSETLHHDIILKSQKTARMAISLLLIISTVVVALYLVSTKRQRQLKLRQKENERQLETERQTHRMQQSALSGRLKQSNIELKELRKSLESARPKDIQQQEVVGKYSDEAICQYIIKVCHDKHNPIKSTVPISAYADIALDYAQKAQLKQAAIRHYGDLFEKIKQQHPSLKEKDFLYCYLCLLGLDNGQIAVLLQHSSSTIWERERRLKKIFGSDDKIVIILHGFMTNYKSSY